MGEAIYSAIWSAPLGGRPKVLCGVGVMLLASFRTRPFLFLAASLLLCSDAGAQSLEAGGEAPPALADGDAAVSGFSGIILSSPTLPPGVDPIDRTFIDLNGASLRVFDLSNVGGDAKGEILQPVVKLEVRARDIGQVFGLAFDEGSRGRSA